VLALAPLLASIDAVAGEPSADEIAKKSLDNGIFAATNGRAVVDLEIKKAGAVVRTRKVTTLIKRDDALIRAFVEFESPAEVAGTRFLSVKPKDGKTEQYIYLPAFKKVKRVVGAQRTQSFMGTDFTYADLEGRKVEDASYKKLPDDKVEGLDCWVIEGTPKSAEDEPYGRVVTWVDKEHFLPLKSEFYDKAGKAIEKRLVVKKLGKKDERWLALDSVMSNLKEGTETRVQVSAADFKSPIPEEALTRGALER
jgi:hypothetical protein